MIILPTGPVPFDALSGRFRWLLLGARHGTILVDWLQAMETGIATSSGHLQTPDGTVIAPRVLLDTG